ncbi:MAG: hypothetical protein HETSPECPRED_003057 [Heterodermia speciosa]|uniref:Uncharacterized protein n=1 Tax=Heterodermia speciosa TaxID=116794 RepID=A0A8H3F2N1_9LECA|nr:MAG: hypothetical protein HETSPECPRED_003057 [Heterodermia speciosa]
MGKGRKALKDFIGNIPEEKLTDFPSNNGACIYKDTNFRMDMQSITTDEPKKYNIQIQINSETTVSTLKKLAPSTMVTILPPVDEPRWTAEQTRQALLDNI